MTVYDYILICMYASIMTSIWCELAKSLVIYVM